MWEMREKKRVREGIIEVARANITVEVTKIG